MSTCYPAVAKGKCTVTEAAAVKEGFDGTAHEELQAAIATLSDDCMVCVATSMMAAGDRKTPNEADVNACAADPKGGCFGPVFWFIGLFVMAATSYWSAVISHNFHKLTTLSLHRAHGETVAANCIKRWAVSGEHGVTYYIRLRYYVLKPNYSDRAYQVTKEFCDENENICENSFTQVNHIMCITGDARSAVLEWTLRRPCINGLGDVVGIVFTVGIGGIWVVAAMMGVWHSPCPAAQLSYLPMICGAALGCHRFW